jgi:tRNA1(Val) A37 N6-methylase TrmN6
MNASRSLEVRLNRDESIDDFMDGRLRLIQSRSGYRFSVDAVLLSEFVTVKRGDLVVDLGTGCGIIPLILLQSGPVGFACGIEIQDELAKQAARNILLNGFQGKMVVIRGDVRHLPFLSGSVDVVVCNPPYRKKETGRINPDRQRAIARHEIMLSLPHILDSARYLLKGKGRLAMIYPCERLGDVMAKMRSFGLEPKRLRMVYPSLDSEAILAMIEASPGGKPGLKVLPPLIDQGELYRK